MHDRHPQGGLARDRQVAPVEAAGGLCGDRAATAREGVGHPLRAGELARDGAGRVGLNLRHLVAHEAVVALTPLEEVARLQRVVAGLVGLS